jgi:hypothetical protein
MWPGRSGPEERQRCGFVSFHSLTGARSGRQDAATGDHLGRRAAGEATSEATAVIQAQPSTDREIDARDLGRRIAQARYEAGWMTQKTLAELLCVCRRSVQAYEAGKTIPYRHLHRLQEIFEKPASWFLYGSEPNDGDAAGEEAPDDPVLKLLEGQTRVLKALAAEMRAVRNELRSVARN